jgi:hypothetical protein
MYGERDDPATVLTHLSQRIDSALAPDSVLQTIGLGRPYDEDYYLSYKRVFHEIPKYQVANQQSNKYTHIIILHSLFEF